MIIIWRDVLQGYYLAHCYSEQITWFLEWVEENQV